MTARPFNQRVRVAREPAEREPLGVNSLEDAFDQERFEQGEPHALVDGGLA